jgi:hypothetical protein
MIRPASRIALILAVGLSTTACVIDPNMVPGSYPPPDREQRDVAIDNTPQQGPRKLVKAITYPKGQVSYFATANSSQVAPDKVRICLENNTGQPKAMRWKKIQSGVNHLNTPRNGSQSCATLSTNQRVEWNFVDRYRPVKPEAMNLHSFGGRLIEFIWVRDY